MFQSQQSVTINSICNHFHISHCQQNPHMIFGIFSNLRSDSTLQQGHQPHVAFHFQKS